MSIYSRLVKFIIFTTFLLLVTGCDQGRTNESDWKVGSGDLSEKVGDVSYSYNALDKEITDNLFNTNNDLWEKYGYDLPTGSWFFENGQGKFGYGLTTGTQHPGGDFFVSFIAHEDSGLLLKRDVRIQLKLVKGLKEKTELLVDHTIFVEKVEGEQVIYSDYLPEQKNATYLLSVEIINEQEEVVDTRVSFIYVPDKKMNARLSTNKEIYSTGDSTLTLILENYGPTFLYFGISYSIEKKVADTWRVVPLNYAFIDIGITLPLDERYEQEVDLSDLEAGEYRIVKEIGAQGITKDVTLATEFTIN